MASLLYRIYKNASWHSKSLKENRQGPEHLLSLSRYLLTVYWHKSQPPPLSIDTSVRTASQNLGLPMACRPCRRQKRRDVKLSSVRNSRNLETTSKFCVPLFFLSLPRFGKSGKLNPRWVDNWKQSWRVLRVLGQNTHMGSVCCPVCLRTCAWGQPELSGGEICP